MNLQRYLLCWLIPLLLAGTAWGIAVAYAQDAPPITVSYASVHYTFGQQATFELGASAPTTITAAYLYLQPQGTERVEVQPVPIEPGPTIHARYVHDLHLSPFPPFSQVSWWWEVRDAAGHSLLTEPASLSYIDNRFSWHTTAEGPVSIHTVVDDPVLARAALDTARNSMESIAQQLDAPLPEQVNIYIYPSQEDIRAALEMAGREWVGGQARPELGVILVSIPNGHNALLRMERDIPHELTHLLIYQIVGPEGYLSVPAWLNEGLATVNELQPDPLLEVTLEDARSRGRLIPLSELCVPFPADPETALLSYAESTSLVRYIQRRYGNGGIRALLEAYADGAGCEGGVLQALGVSLRQLELAWHADMMGLGRWLTWVSENRAWLALWAISILTVLPMAVGLLRGRTSSEASSR
ncbi:MAG TPA: hypothetical protein G4O00_05705 [Thermoflexia bacterium]|nr:hypothetical protein [Thermoflexia bacterium]